MLRSTQLLFVSGVVLCVGCGAPPEQSAITRDTSPQVERECYPPKGMTDGCAEVVIPPHNLTFAFQATEAWHRLCGAELRKNCLPAGDYMVSIEMQGTDDTGTVHIRQMSGDAVLPFIPKGALLEGACKFRASSTQPFEWIGECSHKLHE